MKGSTDLDKERYSEYHNSYNKLKRLMKVEYYKQRISDCRQNTKMLWKVMEGDKQEK